MLKRDYHRKLNISSLCYKTAKKDSPDQLLPVRGVLFCSTLGDGAGHSEDNFRQVSLSGELVVLVLAALAGDLD